MAITLPRYMQLRLYATRSLSLTGSSYAPLHAKPPANPPRRGFATSSVFAQASPTGPLRTSATIHESFIDHEPLIETPLAPPVPEYDLSPLPWPSLLRNLLTSSVASTPVLFNPSLRIFSAIAYSHNPLLSPTYNPVIRYVLKKTLYSQFCGGETPAEVKATVAGLKQWGIQGVMLCWAREVEIRGAREETSETHKTETGTDLEEINAWLEGTRGTMNLTSAGDFVSIKFSGTGQLNLDRLRQGAAPSPTLARGLEDLCEEARLRGVAIAIDAEQQALQPGIEAWTLDLQRRYNQEAAVVIGTYQAYLCSTAERLSRELSIASQDGFVLGVKLVRGAYLASDPRALIHATKAATDGAFDDLAASMIAGQWSAAVPPPPEAPNAAYPKVRLILASHNALSAQRGVDAQRRITPTFPIVHAQLMGMADHVSCALVRARRAALADLGVTSSAESNPNTNPEPAWVPRPYKYLVWGTMDECLKYLVRRAEENRDAGARTQEERSLLWKELRRRLGF